jgi:hypothetical protein
MDNKVAGPKLSKFKLCENHDLKMQNLGLTLKLFNFVLRE